MALTEHPVGKHKYAELLAHSQYDGYEMTYSDDDELSYESFDDFDGRAANQQSPFKYHANTGRYGTLTSSSMSGTVGQDDLLSLMSAVKTLRETQSALSGYPSCRPGSPLFVTYNSLVVPPDNVNVIEVLGMSLQLAWSFAPPQPKAHSPRGVSMVRPEMFSVLYWEHGTSMSDVKSKDTKGLWRNPLFCM